MGQAWTDADEEHYQAQKYIRSLPADSISYNVKAVLSVMIAVKHWTHAADIDLRNISYKDLVHRILEGNGVDLTTLLT